MTDDAEWRLIEKRAKKTGETDASPQDLKAFSVSNLLETGVDVTTVSKMTGHVIVLRTGKVRPA